MNRLPLLLAAMALAGLGISTYLTIAHWGNTSIACAGVGECDFVNTSAYATLGGIPVSGLGALVYIALVGLALIWNLRRDDERLPVLYWGVALAGFGYAAYLTFVEVSVLKAFCVWCLTSAGILTASVLLSTVALLRSPQS